MSNQKVEHYYLVIPARNYEHDEALQTDLVRLCNRRVWPQPIMVPVMVDPTLPPDAAPIVETATKKEQRR